MQRSLVFVLAGLAVGLAGCQTSQGFKAPAGVSDAQFQEDADNCSAQAMQKAPPRQGEWNGTGGYGYDLRTRLMTYCMRDKGYTPAS
jgi:hypothetical protein